MANDTVVFDLRVPMRGFALYSIIFMFAFSSDRMRVSSAAICLLPWLAACPAQETKPAATSDVQGAGPSKSSAISEASVAHVSIGDATVPSEGALLHACDSGAECAARGKQAFDEKRYVEAHQLFERSCELKDAHGCTWLALDLKDPNDPRVPVDPARVAPTLLKACELGDPQACWMLANGYRYGNRSGVVSPEPERAIALYQKGCEAGDAGSCASLADCYELGEGAKKDRAMARKYRERAEDLGYVGE